MADISQNRPTQNTTPATQLVEEQYLIHTLWQLLEIPSPVGYTDTIVHFVGDELAELGIDFEVTRRGAIRASLPGQRRNPNRAVVAHLDTLGAMVTRLKDNGRLALAALGHWSARFAEGARVTVFTDTTSHRGTILPLKASGHIFGDEIDSQSVGWDHVELRLDEHVESEAHLHQLGVSVGDYVAVDPQPEQTDAGFIVSRHLDDKGGVAALLAAARSITRNNITLPMDCHLLFTIFEEVGSGASAVLHQEVSEMVALDNATPGPGQNASEYDVTIAMKDRSGPFDYHLTRQLLALADEHGIPHRRDVHRYYRCDAASALEAGNDIRVALAAFGVDSSHGWERTHISALVHLAELIGLYMQSEPVVERDRMAIGPMKGFPEQPTE